MSNRYLGICVRPLVHNILLVVFMLCAMPSWSATTERYVITLKSSAKPITVKDLPSAERLAAAHAYVLEAVDGQTVRYVLRLGFFDTEAVAAVAMKELAVFYPVASIDPVDEAEYGLAFQARIATSADIEKVKPVAAVNLDLARARQALTDNDAVQAQILLQRVLKAATGKDSYNEQGVSALELLGLAKERGGDAAGARKVYTDFLTLYQEGEAADRVRQRLIVLQTATAESVKPLAKSPDQENSMDWFGSFSQFSNRNIRFLDTGGYQVSSALFNDLNLGGRYHGKTVDVRTQMSTSYRYYFKADSTNDDRFRLSTLYADISERRYNTGVIVGRQPASKGGVLGRFDGLWFSQRVTPHWKYNLAAGYPVDLSDFTMTDEEDKQFVSFSLDMGTFAKSWDFNLFGMEQTVNGITDRQAAGGEVRFSSNQQAHFAMLDYDTSYQELNSFMLVGNWFMADATTFNLIYDYRKLPFLATTNALIGRTEPGIPALLSVLSEAEIRQLALDRTATMQNVTLGASRPVNERFQINGDVSLLTQQGTPASGGVAEVPDSGDQYSYSLTLIGSGLIKEGDISLVGLRYYDSETSLDGMLNLNIRYPVTNAWHATPGLTVDYRDGKNAIDQVTYRPSMRIDYHWLSNISFDAEISGLIIDTLGAGGDLNTDVFFELGYRVDF